VAHSLSVKEQVRSLRLAGYSYSYIASQTGLSKGTLSDWLAKVPYTPNSETVRTIGKARAASGEKIAKKRLETFVVAKQEAAEEIGNVSQRDLFMFGLGIYLGEGSKAHEQIRIVNSDPRVIRSAIAWFKSLGLDTKNFVIKLHLYPDSDVEKSIEYWGRVTGVPRGQFLKSQIDWRKGKKAYKLGKLPYGTTHLGIRCLGDKKFGVFFSRKIMAWIEETAKRIEMRD